MKLITMLAAAAATFTSIVAAAPFDGTTASLDANSTDVSFNERDLVERDAVYNCDDKAYWLGVTNCAYIWTGIWYLEDKVGDRELKCPSYTRCRWSCAYRSALYLDNKSKNEIKTTGKKFAAEVRDVLANCRGDRSCTEDANKNWWFRGEKDYGRDEHRIIVSHTTPFNEDC